MAQCHRRSDGGVRERSNLDFGKEALHHDIGMMPNGNTLIISWIFGTAKKAPAHDWARQADRDRIVLDKVHGLKPDLAKCETEVVGC